jgi:hypothetical protein
VVIRVNKHPVSSGTTGGAQRRIYRREYRLARLKSRKIEEKGLVIYVLRGGGGGFYDIRR